ncbi:MAG: hypothetical protein HY443_00570 [Candidatus Nealsonbacteria bacterium]|nr:hypothetical protein [Candidatus Nealsonbacteria bacterium]
MKKIKGAVTFVVVLSGLAFLFGPEIFPENSQLVAFSEDPFPEEVVIIFNSGGWGNTPLDKANDFNHIIRGIQETLGNWGRDSLVIPYRRAGNGFWGKITASKETLRSFQSQSAKLAKEIERFLLSNPDKTIVMAGLSNGAAFEESTMEKISEEMRSRVLTIEAGIPFWEEKKVDAENVLRLDNHGRDFLAGGQVKDLLFALIRAPGKWLLAKVAGESLPLARSFQAKGHRYSWDEVGPEVSSFLENRLK